MYFRCCERRKSSAKVQRRFHRYNIFRFLKIITVFIVYFNSRVIVLYITF